MCGVGTVTNASNCMLRNKMLLLLLKAANFLLCPCEKLVSKHFYRHSRTQRSAGNVRETFKLLVLCGGFTKCQILLDWLAL